MHPAYSTQSLPEQYERRQCTQAAGEPERQFFTPPYFNMKQIFFAFSAIILAFLSGTAVSAQSADSVKTAVIKVNNLHCNGDMPAIKKRLLNQDGIDDVAFTDRNEEMSTFTVKYHSSVVSEAAIEKTVETTPGCDDQSETPYRVVKERPRKKKKG